MNIQRIKNLARAYIPHSVYGAIRTRLGHYQYQERAGLLYPKHHAYGLHMAVRIAEYYGIKNISAIEFGVANGRGLSHMERLKIRLENVYDIGIDLFGFDTGTGLPKPLDYRDNTDHFYYGDFPMQSSVLLQHKLDAKILFGDVRDLYKLPEAIKHPIGFVSLDLDYYSSTIAALNLLKTAPILPQTSLYLDDCLGSMDYSRFTGELLAVAEFNLASKRRKIDVDRHVAYWHRENLPWMAAMHVMHDFEHPTRYQKLSDGVRVIKSS